MQLGDVSLTFHVAQNRLTNCLDAYAIKPSFSNLPFRIWNMVRALFGFSPWQMAKRELKKEALKLIQPHSLNREFEFRADALSELILRYLVTSHSIKAGAPNYLIPQKTWEEAKMSTMTLNGIIDHVGVVGATWSDFKSVDQNQLTRLLTWEKRALERLRQNSLPLINACSLLAEPLRAEPHLSQVQLFTQKIHEALAEVKSDLDTDSNLIKIALEKLRQTRAQLAKEWTELEPELRPFLQERQKLEAELLSERQTFIQTVQRFEDRYLTDFLSRPFDECDDLGQMDRLNNNFQQAHQCIDRTTWVLDIPVNTSEKTLQTTLSDLQELHKHLNNMEDLLIRNL